ncbi:MAG: GntR family transcriptional regulator [Christensenellales bacterium]|jgi:DNA-binding GntR family transcriptional regulator
MKNKNTSLSEPVYNYLLHLILTLQIKQGEKIPEAQIAKDLGVSRTPLREAIRQLANDGLVTILPNRHVEVSTYSVDYIRNIGEIRLFFELMSMFFSLYYGSKADFERLNKIAVECRTAAEEGDEEKRLTKDAEFHLELARCSNNPILLKFQNQLSLQVQLIQANKTITTEKIREFCNYQENIVKHLFNMDEAELYKTIVNHYTRYYNLDKYYPDGFFDGLHFKK